MKYCLVLTTVPSLKEARQLSKRILASRLAACVSIIPGVESHYRWKKKIEKSREYLLLIKTRATLFHSLKRGIQKNHSYEVPEILQLPIQQGHTPYLNWVAQETHR